MTNIIKRVLLILEQELMPKKKDNFFQKSNMHTRIILSIAALGILFFLVSSSLLPYKNQLFNLLYPKPPSKAEEITNLTIAGINSSNKLATLNGYNFSWNAGSIPLTAGAYAVMFVTLKDNNGNILDQNWFVGSEATEGLFFNGSYTFPAAGTAVITVWETNKVDCVGFSCNPTLAIHNSTPFTVPGPTPAPTLTPTPSPTATLSPSPTPTATPISNYGSIDGTVYSSAGGVVGGAKITVRNGRKTLYTSSLGTYSILDLTPGIYKLTFQAKNYFNQSLFIEVFAGQTALGDMVMRRK